MANVFDQFDAQPAPAQQAAPNVFDQFDHALAQVQQAQPQSVLDKLTGSNGPRFQTWPERLVRGLVGSASDALSLPHDYIQEQTQASPSQISDSDVSTLSPSRATNFAAFASPTGGQSIPTGMTRAIPPTREALEAAKTAAYDHPDVTNLRLSPSAGPALVDKIRSELINNKLDPINAPNVLSTVANVGRARFELPNTQTQTILSGPGYHIAEDIANPAPLQVADLDLTRQSLSSVPPEQQRAAAIARKVIDNYLGNIPTSDVVAGNAAAANAKLLEARGNASALFRDKQVSDALVRADNQTGSTYSGTNLDNATRQQLRPILNDKMGVSKNKKAFQDYTPEEIAALRTAVNGTRLSNTVRTAGKLVGGGHGVGGFAAGMAAAAAAHEAGLPLPLAAATGVGVGVGGSALTRWANAMATQRSQALSDILRMRSPLGAQMPPSPVMAPVPAFGAPMLGFNFGRPLFGVVPAGANPQQ